MADFWQPAHKSGCSLLFSSGSRCQVLPLDLLATDMHTTQLIWHHFDTAVCACHDLQYATYIQPDEGLLSFWDGASFLSVPYVYNAIFIIYITVQVRAQCSSSGTILTLFSTLAVTCSILHTYSLMRRVLRWVSRAAANLHEDIIICGLALGL